MLYLILQCNTYLKYTYVKILKWKLTISIFNYLGIQFKNIYFYINIKGLIKYPSISTNQDKYAYITKYVYNVRRYTYNVLPK